MLEIAGGILLACFAVWLFGVVILVALNAMFSTKPAANTVTESPAPPRPTVETPRYFPEVFPGCTAWYPSHNRVSKEERDAEVEKVHSAPQYAAMKAYMANKKQGHSFSV